MVRVSPHSSSRSQASLWISHIFFLLTLMASDLLLILTVMGHDLLLVFFFFVVSISVSPSLLQWLHQVFWFFILILKSGFFFPLLLIFDYFDSEVWFFFSCSRSHPLCSTYMLCFIRYFDYFPLSFDNFLALCALPLHYLDVIDLFI